MWKRDLLIWRRLQGLGLVSTKFLSSAVEAMKSFLFNQFRRIPSHVQGLSRTRSSCDVQIQLQTTYCPCLLQTNHEANRQPCTESLARYAALDIRFV